MIKASRTFGDFAKITATGAVRAFRTKTPTLNKVAHYPNGL